MYILVSGEPGFALSCLYGVNEQQVSRLKDKLQLQLIIDPPKKISDGLRYQLMITPLKLLSFLNSEYGAEIVSSACGEKEIKWTLKVNDI
ncbi:hypothetical protein QYM36_011178 [Artemia franciscana]|uniref:Uncharacterized protein n=1 Tax=Artemia franciscana TaxID=6661 RepID=A0AA88HI35_ARTSF|nr:hypothetical protein QYM36_011178 [Artemia franciscana]